LRLAWCQRTRKWPPQAREIEEPEEPKRQAKVRGEQKEKDLLVGNPLFLIFKEAAHVINRNIFLEIKWLFICIFCFYFRLTTTCRL
jgi:hypothetical protein